MLTFLRSNLYAALVVGVLVAAALLYGHQWGAGNARLACADARAAAERETSNALAVLARQHAQAEAAAERLRAETRRLAGEVTRARNENLAALPATAAVVDEPRRLLIHSSYCARFPDAPACVPD